MNQRRTALSVAVLSAFLAIGCSTEPAAPRPNIVLISADTLRADHVGANGYPRATTPAIDALAKEGVNFTRAYSHAPNTAPSHTSILTSLYPSVHGVFQHGEVPDENLVHLPEALRDAGYQTGAFTQLNGRTFEPGFDTWHFMESAVERGKGMGLDDIDLVADWVGERTAPWFLFLHSYDVHLPYAPEGEYAQMWAADYDGPLNPNITRDVVDRINGEIEDEAEWMEASDRDRQFIVDMYDAELRRLDDIYAAFFARLRAMDQYDNTIFVFLSDHGEEFGEHGKWGRHTYTINEELLRTPLIIAGPGIPVGQVFDQAVGLVDVAPTILTLAGVAAPRNFMGRDLAAIWSGSERQPREILAERPGHRALIHAGFKYTSDGELFDLTTDKWGTIDVAAENPDVAARMSERLLEWTGRFIDMAGVIRPAGDVQLTPEEERRLRALGYLQ